MALCISLWRFALDHLVRRFRACLPFVAVADAKPKGMEERRMGGKGGDENHPAHRDLQIAATLRHLATARHPGLDNRPGARARAR